MKRLLLGIFLFLGLPIHSMDDDFASFVVQLDAGDFDDALGWSSPSSSDISIPSQSDSFSMPDVESSSSQGNASQQKDDIPQSMSLSIPKSQPRLAEVTPINSDDFFKRSVFSSTEKSNANINQSSQTSSQSNAQNVDTSQLFKRSLFAQKSSTPQSEPKVDTAHLFKRSLFDPNNTSNTSSQTTKSNDRVHARSYTFQKQAIPNRHISVNELLSVEVAKPALIRHPDGNLSTGVVIPTPDSNHSAVYEVGPLNSSALAVALKSSNPSVKPLSNTSDYNKPIVFDLRDGQLTEDQQEQPTQDAAHPPKPVVNKGITTSKSMQEGLNLKAREKAERTQAFRARVQKENQDFIKSQLKQGRSVLWDRELQKRYGTFPDRYGNEYPGIKQWDGRVIIGNMNNRTRWIDNDGYIHTAPQSNPNFSKYEEDAAQERYEAQRQERINAQFNRFWTGARSYVKVNQTARNLAKKCDNYSQNQLKQAVQKLDHKIKVLEDRQKIGSFKLAVCRSLKSRLSKRMNSDQIGSASINQVTTSPQINDNVTSNSSFSNNETVSFEQPNEEQLPPLSHREVLDNDPITESDHDEDSNNDSDEENPYDQYGFDYWVRSPIKAGAAAIDGAMDWTADRVVDAVEWLTGNEDVGALAEGLLNLPKRPVHLFTRPLDTLEGLKNLGKGLGRVFGEAIEAGAAQYMIDTGALMNNPEFIQEGVSHLNEQQKRFDQAYRVFDEIDRRQKISTLAELAGGIWFGTPQGRVAQAKVIGAGKKLFGHAKKLGKRVYNPGFKGPRPRIIAVAEGAAEEISAVLRPQPNVQRPSMHMRNNPQKTRAPRRSRSRINKPKTQKSAKSSLRPADRASSSQSGLRANQHRVKPGKQGMSNAEISAKNARTKQAESSKRLVHGNTLPIKSGIKYTKHCLGRMHERGITPSMVKTTIDKGWKYYDSKNKVINCILKNGFASGKDLLVGINPITKEVVTVIRGKNLINRRFISIT